MFRCLFSLCPSSIYTHDSASIEHNILLIIIFDNFSFLFVFHYRKKTKPYRNHEHFQVELEFSSTFNLNDRI